jgi:hypothetical protein
MVFTGWLERDHDHTLVQVVHLFSTSLCLPSRSSAKKSLREYSAIAQIT